MKKTSNNNLIYHLKELEKEQTKPQLSRRKRIIKIREEINRIEIKKKTILISKTYKQLMKLNTKKNTTN